MMIVFLLVSAVLPAPSHAVDFTPGQIEFFEKKVRPVLAENCHDCHSGKHAKNGLRLDTRQGVLRGTDYHRVIDLKSPSASRLLLAVRHAGPGVEKMPEKGAKLSGESIDALENWIRMGLPWPASTEAAEVDSAAAKHWAFQSVAKPELPANAGNPIDWFVRKKLAESKLEPAPRADRYTLYRRAHFDLLGLPPKYEELREFENDSRPHEEAWPAFIDRLLASPHYGERWARHWMDVARYSDTKGYEAGGRERRFVYSHTYRDWLIRAFNDDLPYDRFVLFQLAADQLVQPDKPEKQHLAAMGFLTLSNNGREEEVIDDRLDTTFRGLQALTIACARCHDHKSDPISATEYYGLYGVFRDSTPPGEYPAIGEPRPGPEYDAYRKKLAEKQKVVDDFLEPKLAEIAKTFPEIANRRIQLIGKLERADRRKLEDLQKVVDKFVADSGMEPDKALTLIDRPTRTAQRVFIRGNPGRPGEVAPRRFLSCVAGEDAPEFQNGSGRLEMARTIASEKNPLTARVIVNRVWMHHFGEGIVASESDFGVQASQPSHPELLDWLAGWFMENGWSIKKLHRLILTSETWRQAPAHPNAVAGAAVDPENRLLWRQNRQRLDFEQMRDSMLAIAGNLDPQLFGRPVPLLEPPFSHRRSVYAFIDRQNVLPTLRVFDFANPQQHTGQRPRTTIPMQALFAMNSPFVQAQSRALARSPGVAGCRDSAGRIQAIHRAILAREAGKEELLLASVFVKQFDAEANSSGPADVADAWESYAQALLGTNDFLFVD